MHLMFSRAYKPHHGLNFLMHMSIVQFGCLGAEGRIPNACYSYSNIATNHVCRETTHIHFFTRIYYD